MALKVTILSRHDAVAFCHKPNNSKERTVMISISDPNMIYTSAPFVSKDNGLLSILRLSFSDADHAGEDVYKNQVDEALLMSAEDGDKVAAFLETYRPDAVIVHCDAGISRSSGVGAAIEKFYNGSDERIFGSYLYCPNMLCYRVTLEARMRRHLHDTGT